MTGVARHVVLLGALAGALAVVPWAAASQPIDTGATGVTLSVNSKGEALVTYTAHGKLKHVLAWGAVNALAPSAGGKQVAFSLDYAGGFGKYHKAYWKTFGGSCAPYDGPPLAWEVAACKAPDGSYWALQAWQRGLPDYGVSASGRSAETELHLSHWTGALPVLSVTTDHVPGKHDEIFGTLTLNGGGVFGFKASSSGVPLDTFGRNIYLDTFDSAYGSGWKRENSFLTHGPGGSFCYSFSPHGSHPSGDGTKYRATVEGPGVTPDVEWTGDASGPLSAAAHKQILAELEALHDSGSGGRRADEPLRLVGSPGRVPPGAPEACSPALCELGLRCSLFGGLLAAAAQASVGLSTGASHVSLQVDASGDALVTWSQAGAKETVLLTAHGVLTHGGSLTGPDVSKPTHVAGVPSAFSLRSTPGGNLWALQLISIGAGRPVSLDLSNRQGAPTDLTLATDGTHVTGSVTFDGKPVTGFSTTPGGLRPKIYVYLDCFGCGGQAGVDADARRRPARRRDVLGADPPEAGRAPLQRATVAGPNAGIDLRARRADDHLRLTTARGPQKKRSTTTITRATEMPDSAGGCARATIMSTIRWIVLAATAVGMPTLFAVELCGGWGESPPRSSPPRSCCRLRATPHPAESSRASSM